MKSDIQTNWECNRKCFFLFILYQCTKESRRFADWALKCVCFHWINSSFASFHKHKHTKYIFSPCSCPSNTARLSSHLCWKWTRERDEEEAAVWSLLWRNTNVKVRDVFDLTSDQIRTLTQTRAHIQQRGNIFCTLPLTIVVRFYKCMALIIRPHQKKKHYQINHKAWRCFCNYPKTEKSFFLPTLNIH